MVGNGADCVRTTRINLAWVHAFVVQARLASAAIFVVVASEDALVVQADVAEEAVIIDTTGQNTVSRNALLVQGTVLVRTADWHAHRVCASFAVRAISV